MSFFGPISPPGLDEASAPIFRRALRRAKIVGSFASVQVAVQIIGFFSGILLIRAMDQREYAYFTIANTMQGTLNVLADVGISIGLVSIGGRVWQDRDRFGELVRTALALRRKLGAIAILGVTPVMCFMLMKNGAPPLYAAILVGAVLLGLLVQLPLGVFSVVPRLHSDIGRIQTIDITGSVARFVLLAALLFLYLNAGVALAVGAIALFIQYWMLRRYVGGVINLNTQENPDDRAAISTLIRSQAASAVFYCIQGQITIFLISFFGTRAASVAEVGALGRLAMIFTVLSNLLTNVFGPAFARCHVARTLRWQYAAIVGGVAAFSLIVLIGAACFPDAFLFVLGRRYSHLQRELLLMVAGSVLGAIVNTLWALNASKAWVHGAWFSIPLTVATQIALVPFTDFSSVSEVLIFNLISTIPNLLLNIVLSVRGFRRLPAESG